MITRWDDYRDLSVCRNTETLPVEITGMVVNIKGQWFVYQLEGSQWEFVKSSVSRNIAKVYFERSLDAETVQAGE